MNKTTDTIESSRELKGRRLYFAYGSNLNLAQFCRRCPAALQVSRATLDGWVLVFKGVADVVPCDDPRALVQGALYEITDECEEALDRYEGFPVLYRKERILATLPDGEQVEAMVYVMNRTGILPPAYGYYWTISEGFRDWGIGEGTLKNALARSVRSAGARDRRQAFETAKPRKEKVSARSIWNTPSLPPQKAKKA